LLKEICGLANNQGGYLIFGIKETDDEPPVPKSFPGIDSEYDLLRIEQVINSNISPPLLTEIATVDDNDNCFIIIRVPDGANKPYYNTKKDRYFIRYNTEVKRMTENQISSFYRERFTSPQKVKDYLEEVASHHQKFYKNVSKADIESPLIFGHIFIFPPNLNKRKILKIDKNTLKKKSNSMIKFGRKNSSSFPTERQYNKFGLAWYDSYNPKHRLEVHRNGLIHHAQNYGAKRSDKNYLRENYIGEHLLMTFQFAGWVFKKINYFGPATIILKCINTKNVLSVYNFENTSRKFHKTLICYSESVKIERESSSWKLHSQAVEITKSIMDEFMNYFGYHKFIPFMKNGYFSHLLD